MKHLLRYVGYACIPLAFVAWVLLLPILYPAPPNGSGPPPTYAYRFGPPTPTPTVTPALWREK